MHKLGRKEFDVKFLPVDQLDVLQVFEDVQRKLEPSRARAISAYVERNLEEGYNVFFAPIVANLRADGTYSVNDGQHRVEGLKKLFNDLMTKRDKLIRKFSQKSLGDEQRSELSDEKQKIDSMLTKLRSWKIAVMVYQGLTPEEERQLFHDLNNFTKKPAKSISLIFDTADLFTVLAKETVKEMGQFEDKVEWGNKLESSSNFLFSNIHGSIIKLLGKKKDNLLSEENFDEKKEIVKKFFEIYFNSLPQDYMEEAYIYNLAPTLQALTQYGNHLLALKSKGVDWAVTLENTLSSVQMTHSNPLFANIGKVPVTSDGKLAFRGTGSAVKAIFETLKAVTKYISYEGKQVFPYDEIEEVEGGQEELSDEDLALTPEQLQEVKEEVETETGKGKGKGKSKAKGKGKASDKLSDATDAPNSDSNPVDPDPLNESSDVAKETAVTNEEVSESSNTTPENSESSNAPENLDEYADLDLN